MTNQEQVVRAMSLILLTAPQSEWRKKLIDCSRLYDLSHDDYLVAFKEAMIETQLALNTGPQLP